MRIETILESKGPNVESMPPSVTAGEAIKLMVDKNIGTVVVMDEGGSLLGLFTERCIVRWVAQHPDGNLVNQKIGDLISSELIVCSPTSSVQAVSASMLKMHLRHLPVMDNGELVGIVSIGDVLKHRITELKAGEETRFQHWFESEGVHSFK